MPPTHTRPAGPPRPAARRLAAALIGLTPVVAAAGCSTPARGLAAEAVSARSTAGAVTILGEDGVFATILAREGEPLVVTDLRAHGDRPVLRPDLLSGAPTDPGVSRDHPFHRGLRVGHGWVDGHDLWTDVDASALADSALVMLPDGRAELSARVAWSSPGGDLLCTESRRMRFGSFGGLRVVDLDLRLEATGNGVTFGDTKGGLVALRLADAMAPGAEPLARAFDSEGRTDGEIWGQEARWVAHASSALALEPDGEGVTVALFDHPDNHRAPARWHARPYGLVAANPFGVSAFGAGPEGLGAFHLDAYGALELRYRIVVVDGEPGAEGIDALWREFAGRPGEGEGEGPGDDE